MYAIGSQGGLKGRQGVYTLWRFKSSVGQPEGSYDRAIGFVYVEVGGK